MYCMLLNELHIYLKMFFRIFIWIEKRMVLIYTSTVFLDIQTEKIQWWYLNHTLDDGIIDCLAGTYKRCLMKSIEWRVGPLSFNKRGGEGMKRRDYTYNRSKIQKLFIHDCIIGIVQNSIVKWKYGWQVLELHRSCSSRDDDRQHGAVNAGHLKRYILPLWLQPAPSRESFSNFPYVRT